MKSSLRLISTLKRLFGVAILFAFFSPAMAQQSVLHANEWLMPGEYMRSPNGKYELRMQHDGNLVLYRASNMQVLWHSNTYMYPGLRAVMQGDGNFVLYDGWVDYGQYYSYWHSNTWQHHGSTLHLQDDGNLVIYRSDGYVPWHTNTPQLNGCYATYGGWAFCVGLQSGNLGEIVGYGYFEPYPMDYDIWSGELCWAIEPLPYTGDVCY
jgi:hypothetical protein